MRGHSKDNSVAAPDSLSTLQETTVQTLRSSEVFLAPGGISSYMRRYEPIRSDFATFLRSAVWHRRGAAAAVFLGGFAAASQSRP